MFANSKDLKTFKLVDDNSVMVVILFWVCFGLILYAYLGYPIAAFLIATILNKKVNKSPYLPHVSIIIPAHNEDRDISETLKNKLQLNYPKGKIEIIVVSDASTDLTEDIVREFSHDGVRLISQESRQGKTVALNKSVREANGEIIVFADANSIYDKDALRKLVANFRDTRIGYVTGRMLYGSGNETAVGEGSSAYMRYENILRTLETRLGSLVGVNGGIDAVRKSLYKPMRPEQQPDLVLPLKVIEQGYRVVFEPDAILRENPLNRPTDEYKMRVRVSLRAINAIKDMKQLLNPLRYGLYSWQLFSHKVLRYGVFVFLAGLYTSTFLILPEGLVYRLAFLLQNVLYLAALSAWYLEFKGKNPRVLYLPFYFCILNLASAEAFIKAILGESQVTWRPRVG